MKEHLIRLHRVAKKFEKAIIEVYKFQRTRGSNEIAQCVEDLQRTILTLEILAKQQVRCWRFILEEAFQGDICKGDSSCDQFNHMAVT